MPDKLATKKDLAEMEKQIGKDFDLMEKKLTRTMNIAILAILVQAFFTIIKLLSN